MATDLTPDQRIAVSCAVGRAMTKRHSSIGFDDLYQIGAEAVLKAKIDETMAPPQRHVYLEMRARGAMLDAVRTSYRQMAHIDHFNDDDADEREEFKRADPGASPETLAIIAETCRRIERMPEPFPTVAAMAADGADCAEIAAALGVSISRISQHRATIRKAIERYL